MQKVTITRDDYIETDIDTFTIVDNGNLNVDTVALVSMASMRGRSVPL